MQLKKQDAAIKKMSANETRLPVSGYPYYTRITNNRSVVEWIVRLRPKL